MVPYTTISKQQAFLWDIAVDTNILGTYKTPIQLQMQGNLTGPLISNVYINVITPFASAGAAAFSLGFTGGGPYLGNISVNIPKNQLAVSGMVNCALAAAAGPSGALNLPTLNLYSPPISANTPAGNIFVAITISGAVWTTGKAIFIIEYFDGF